MEGLIWMWRALVGCGGPEMGVRCFRYGYEGHQTRGNGLGWVWRTMGGWRGTEIDLKGLGWLWNIWDGYRGPLVGVKALNTHLRPSTPQQKNCFARNWMHCLKRFEVLLWWIQIYRIVYQSIFKRIIVAFSTVYWIYKCLSLSLKKLYLQKWIPHHEINHF